MSQLIQSSGRCCYMSTIWADMLWRTAFPSFVYSCLPLRFSASLMKSPLNMQMDSQLVHMKQHIQQARVKQQDLKHERLRTRWTSSQDKIFADLVVQQIGQGNRSNNIFDQKAWEQIRDEFNAKTGLNFNKKQLRKHLDVLRMRYHSIKSAFEQNGSVLEQTSRFTDYELWADLTEEKAPQEPQKIKDCPIYNQLCIIFTESESDGRYAQSSHYKGMDEDVINGESPGLRPATHRVNNLYVPENVSSPAVVMDKNVGIGRKRRQPEAPSTPRPELQNQDEVIGVMAEAMTQMIEASKLSGLSSTLPKVNDHYSISNCIKALDEIQSIDQNLYYASLDLFDDPILREEFMSVEYERRLEWLLANYENMYSSSVVNSQGLLI